MKRWPKKPLIELGEFRGGGTPSRKIPEYFHGDVPWITGADVTTFYVAEAREFITREAIENSATNLLPAKTVLVVTRTHLRKIHQSGAFENFELPFCSRCPVAIVHATNSILHRAQQAGHLKNRIPNSLELQCPACDTNSPSATASVNFQVGGWTLLTLGWTETNSVIWWNDQVIATGPGIPTVPTDAVSLTSLFVGSDVCGQNPATGLLDELTTFTGDTGPRRPPPTPFGLDPAWNLTAYGNCMAAMTLLGPASDSPGTAQFRSRMSAMTSSDTSDDSLLPSFGTNNFPELTGFSRPTSTNGLQQVYSWPRLGTFWTLQCTNCPPLPFDPCTNCPVYVLDSTNSIFLVDDTGYTYPAPSPSDELGASQTQTNSFADGTLYLNITGMSNGVLNVILYGTTNGESYTLQSTESLSGSNVAWLVEQDVFGASDTNWTALQVPTFGRTNLFLRAHVGSDDGPRVLFLQITGISGGTANLQVYSTGAGQTYDIQTKQNLIDVGWTSQGPFTGLTNWTPTTVSVGSGASMFMRVRCWMDNGSGIPVWWGNLYGISDIDPYALCPSGDGWTMLQAFQNGWNPWDWHTPPAPSGLTVKYYGASSNVIVQWNPSPGPVTNYVICRYTTIPSGGQTNYSSVASPQTTFSDALPSGMPDPDWPPVYQIMAQYPNGSSAWSPPVSLYSPGISLDVILGGGIEPFDSSEGLGAAYFYDPFVTASARVVRGPQGHFYLVTGYVPPGIAKLRISVSANSLVRSYPFSPEANYLWEDVQPFTNAPSASLEVSATALQSGFYQLPDWLLGWYGCYQIDIQSVAVDGTESECRPLAGGLLDMWRIPYGPAPVDTIPFLDGRRQIKENAEFQLRAAQGAYVPSGSPPYTNQEPFSIEQSRNSSTYIESASVDYVTAGFHYFYSNFGSTGFHFGSGLVLDEFRPFEQNYFYANFLVAGPPWLTYTEDCSSGTCVPAGIPSPAYSALFQVDQPSSQFSVNDFVRSGATNAVADVLSPAAAQWIFFGQEGLYTFGADWRTNLGDVVWADFPNLYGLKLLSVVSLPWFNPTDPLVTSYPGDAIPSGYTPSFYEVERPGLANVDYYFARSPVAYTNAYDPVQGYYSALSLVDPRPGEPEFTPSAQTPLMIIPFGQPFSISAWAKEATINVPNKFAYLEQYFENALTIGADGNPTTNSAGLLSPYGEFFPMMPGPVALVTMPDLDTGQRGTGVVNVIKLQLDVNHDGTMDLSFGGPDNTSQARPFVFWINNDNDGTGVGADIPIKPGTRLDYQYGQIRSWRNLEDFARLWVCGLPTFPTQDYTVTLSMSPSAGNPAINLYRAATNSAAYLSTTNAAIDQFTTYTLNGEVMFDFSKKVGTVSSNQSYTLPLNSDGSPQYTNFLFEGAGVGAGQLVLTLSQVTPQDSNVVAQTSVWFDLHDIKDFYEQVVTTNTYSGAISNWSSIVESVQRSSSLALGTDTNILVLVHGINVDYPSWLIEADTVFKRLYWSGFAGQFATLKWHCLAGLQTIDFNASELNAYKSADAMKSYLLQLRDRFPGYGLHLLVHSQGNAVVSEALEKGAPFDTYILTQGALPAGAYDVNYPLYARFTNAEMVVPTPEWQPMGYRGIYTNLSGRIVNFYNYKDPVLDVWIADQLDLKPNELAWNGGNYFFDGSNSWHLIEGAPPLLVTDPQESRSMVSRSRTLPIGQSGPASAHGVIQSAVDLNAQYGFANSFPDDHSAQWVRPIQTTRPYFQQVLTSCGMLPAP